MRTKQLLQRKFKMIARKMYLQGVIDAEDQLDATQSLDQVKEWLKVERKVIQQDYRWDQGIEGVQSFIKYKESLLCK